MTAKVTTIYVVSPVELQQTVTGYIAQGFTVQTVNYDATTMFKKKEFNIVWAIIGFALCVIPLLIYAIVYAQEQDEMIIIQVGTPLLALPADVSHLQWTPDRMQWWDGASWVPAAVTPPPMAPRSPDGQTWWDGESWRE